MIQRIGENEDGNTELEFDLEGIRYLIEGLDELAEGPVGTALSTPAMWEESAPWWRFWNRSSTIVTGDFIIKRVEGSL